VGRATRGLAGAPGDAVVDERRRHREDDERRGGRGELAGEAAHASERIGAPIAAWLSAKAGRSLEESLALARTVTDAP
jgi:hypothetical protein